jgi:hypothetical protein
VVVQHTSMLLVGLPQQPLVAAQLQVSRSLA